MQLRNNLESCILEHKNALFKNMNDINMSVGLSEIDDKLISYLCEESDSKRNELKKACDKAKPEQNAEEIRKKLKAAELAVRELQNQLKIVNAEVSRYAVVHAQSIQGYQKFKEKIEFIIIESFFKNINNEQGVKKPKELNELKKLMSGYDSLIEKVTLMQKNEENRPPQLGNQIKLLELEIDRAKKLLDAMTLVKAHQVIFVSSNLMADQKHGHKPGNDQKTVVSTKQTDQVLPIYEDLIDDAQVLLSCLYRTIIGK